MKPITFPEQNETFAEDQPEYQPLPAHVKQKEGVISVISCWELSPEELQQVKETGKVYLEVVTFGRALQPVMLATNLQELL